MHIENRVAVVDARVREVDIIRVIRARTAGDDKLLRRQRFDGAIVALQPQRVVINKVRVAFQNVAVVTLVKTLTHTRLLVNHAFGMVQDIGERGAKKAGMVAVERVLVKFDNTADCVTERFRGDGAPVRTAAADIMVALNNRYPGSLFNEAHGCAFAAGTGAYHYCIVIVGMWHGKAYLFLYIKAT